MTHQIELNQQLSEACRAEKPDIDTIKELLEKGANPNYLTYELTTADGEDYPRPSRGPCLSWAVKKSEKNFNPELVKLLLKHGANPSYMANEEGRTYLHWLCRFSGHLESIKSLLALNKTDLNAQDYEGCTPLHLAFWKYKDNPVTHLDSIQLILDNGADINLADKDDETPLDYAMQKHPESTELRQNGEVGAALFLLLNKADVKHIKETYDSAVGQLIARIKTEDNHSNLLTLSDNIIASIKKELSLLVSDQKSNWIDGLKTGTEEQLNDIINKTLEINKDKKISSNTDKIVIAEQIQPNKQLAKEDFNNKLEFFKKQAEKWQSEIANIIKPCSENRKEKLEPAIKKALELYDKITPEAEKFFKSNQNEIAKESFKKACTLAITEALPELKKHRTTNKGLANLALALVTLGIGFLIAGLINLAATKGKHFLFFNTDSEKGLEELDDKVTDLTRLG